MTNVKRRTEVPVNDGWVGQVLADNIYKEVEKKQVLLLREGTRLNSNNIYGLLRHGVKHMYIWTTRPPDEANKTKP